MRVTVVSLAVALVTALAGPPAIAADEITVAEEEMPTATTRLSLTIIDGSQPVRVSRQVSLTCDPTGGTHPKAAEACRELHAGLAPIAGGSEDPSVHTETRCTTEYAPRTVTAEGHWSRRVIRHRASYSNGCQLRAATGTVFAF